MVQWGQISDEPTFCAVDMFVRYGSQGIGHIEPSNLPRLCDAVPMNTGGTAAMRAGERHGIDAEDPI